MIHAKTLAASREGRVLACRKVQLRTRARTPSVKKYQKEPKASVRVDMCGQCTHGWLRVKQVALPFANSPSQKTIGPSQKVTN